MVKTANQSSRITRQAAVVDRLRQDIMAGVFGAGDRLLEIGLSESLEVSRTPIREALIVLAEEGLVEYRPNRGYVVRSFSLPFIMDAYAVRENLEGLACRLAAERGPTAAMRRRFRDCLERGDQLLSGNKLSKRAREPWGEVNEQFHQLIVEAAGSEPLRNALVVATRLPYASSRVVHWFDENDLEGLFQLRMVHAQHHAIVNAICARESYRAETTMRGHISYAAEHIRSKFTTEPVEKPTNGTPPHSTEPMNDINTGAKTSVPT